MFANLKKLNKSTVFWLAWNGAFFLFAATCAVAFHDVFQVLFMALFAGMFLFWTNIAKRELRQHAALDELSRESQECEHSRRR